MQARAAVMPEFAADPARFSAFVEAVSHESRAIVDRYRNGDEIAFQMHANVAIAYA